MDFIPDQFREVALGTFAQAVCSPAAPSSDWSGVRIKAPQRIIIAAGERPVVPICGYFLVPVLAAMDGPPLAVQVRHVGTKVIVRGTVMEEGSNEPEEPPPPDAPTASRESLAGVSTGGYFNIDAQRYLPGLLAPGVYDVVVTYAGSNSNVLRIEIAGP